MFSLTEMLNRIKKKVSKKKFQDNSYMDYRWGMHSRIEWSAYRIYLLSQRITER